MLLALLLALFSLVVAESTPEEFKLPSYMEEGAGYITPLINTTYKGFVESHEFVLVEVHAGWCLVCKNISPEFAKAAKMATELNIPVKFGALDASHDEAFTRALEVSELPAFLFYRNGAVELFPSLTLAETFVAALARITETEGADEILPIKAYGPETDPLEFTRWIFWRGTPEGKLSTTLVLFSPPVETCSTKEEESECSSDTEDKIKKLQEYNRVYAEAAKLIMVNPQIRIVTVNNAEIIKNFYEDDEDVTEPSIVLYKDHDEGKTVYGGELDAEAIKTWAFKQLVPMVATITHKNLQLYRRNVEKLALIYIDESMLENFVLVRNTIETLRLMAYKLEEDGVVERGKFTIGLTNGEKYQSWVQFMQLPTDVLPVMGGEFITEEKIFSNNYFKDVIDYANKALCQYTESDLGEQGIWNITVSKHCTPEGFETYPRGPLPADEFEVLTNPFFKLPEEETYAWLKKFFAGELTPLEMPVEEEAVEDDNLGKLEL